METLTRGCSPGFRNTASPASPPSRTNLRHSRKVASLTEERSLPRDKSSSTVCAIIYHKINNLPMRAIRSDRGPQPEPNGSNQWSRSPIEIGYPEQNRDTYLRNSLLFPSSHRSASSFGRVKPHSNQVAAYSTPTAAILSGHPHFRHSSQHCQMAYPLWTGLGRRKSLRRSPIV